ncbi:hypothetical protein ABIB34_001141 [Rhodococcus sp. UYP5]
MHTSHPISGHVGSRPQKAAVPTAIAVRRTLEREGMTALLDGMKAVRMISRVKLAAQAHTSRCGPSGTLRAEKNYDVRGHRVRNAKSENRASSENLHPSMVGAPMQFRCFWW